MPGLIDRVCCSVPSCRRTRKPNGYAEWICGDHWRSVPKEARRVYLTAKRAGAGDASRRWERCKRMAIEAATGLR